MPTSPDMVPAVDFVTPREPDRGPLDALFLGPYGENDTMLENLVTGFLRDHVYWRRNFHPEELGKFVPEGSKSGAAAAAVYVTHKVLPLDHAHFGRLPRQTVLAAEAFLARTALLAAELEGVAHVAVPFAPDSNLVCLAINPAGNGSLATANAFVGTLHDELRCDPRQPLQLKQFFGSITTLRPEAVGGDGMRRILASIGIESPAPDAGGGDDHLVILRHTLMNPYLIDHTNGISYIDMYLRHLGGRIRSLLASR